MGFPCFVDYHLLLEGHEIKETKQATPNVERYIMLVDRGAATTHGSTQGLAEDREKSMWAVVVMGERNNAGIAFKGPLGT